MNPNNKRNTAQSEFDSLPVIIIILTAIGIIFMIWDFLRADVESTGLLAIIDFVANGTAVELLSIAFTVGVIDRIIRSREKRENEIKQYEAMRRETIDKLRTNTDKITMGLLIQKLRDEGILMDGSMEDAYLREARLNGATLHDADLRGCNLTEVQLENAILDNANLSRARLVKAMLKGAQLHDAQLDHANLQQVDLSDANLRDASFIGADLTGAIMTKRTILPDGTYWTPTFELNRLTEVQYYSYKRSVQNP